jgi:hypothetical protein
MQSLQRALGADGTMLGSKRKREPEGESRKQALITAGTVPDSERKSASRSFFKEASIMTR